MRTLGDVGAFGAKREVRQFGDDSFWEKRYASNGQTFEWFVSLKECVDQSPMFKGLLESRKPNARVLEIGCGTSELCENLWDMGFRNLTAIDNQNEAIQVCKKRQGAERKINYVVSDMTNMVDFEENSFDMIIDKGALDALVCRGDDNDDLEKCGAEMWRILTASQTSLLCVLSNAPLTEVVDGLKSWFVKEQMWMVKNEQVGQLMAKAYLFSRRKSPQMYK